MTNDLIGKTAYFKNRKYYLDEYCITYQKENIVGLYPFDWEKEEIYSDLVNKDPLLYTETKKLHIANPRTDKKHFRVYNDVIENNEIPNPNFELKDIPTDMGFLECANMKSLTQRNVEYLSYSDFIDLKIGDIFYTHNKVSSNNLHCSIMNWPLARRYTTKCSVIEMPRFFDFKNDVLGIGVMVEAIVEFENKKFRNDFWYMPNTFQGRFYQPALICKTYQGK